MIADWQLTAAAQFGILLKNRAASDTNNSGS
jgi:hypothetical protein